MVSLPPSFLAGISWSDHWSFWKDGYQAVMITDSAYLRNPHYHQMSDLPHTLDYERMSLVVHSLKNAIISLADH